MTKRPFVTNIFQKSNRRENINKYIDKFANTLYSKNSGTHNNPITIKCEDMLEMLEDQYLFAIAQERIKQNNAKTISFDDVIAKHGFTKMELEETEVEFD